MARYNAAMPTGVQTPVFVDARERLAFDIPCAFCGHNLRGLAPSGRCGECGQLVDISLAGSALVGADPRWLDRLTAGVGLLGVCLPWLWCPFAYPLVLLGGWLITAPNPAHRGHAVTRRTLLRIGLLWLMAGPLFMVFSDVFFFWSMPAWLLVYFVAAVLLAVWIALGVRPLARPLGNRVLARRAAAAATILCGAPLFAGGALFWLEFVSYGYDVVSFALLLGAVLCVLCGIALLALTLFGLWRELDVLTARAARYRARSEAPAPAPLNSAAASSPGA